MKCTDFVTTKKVGEMNRKCIVLATANPHKVQEIRQILQELFQSKIDILGAEDVGGMPEVEECGATIEENAYRKAAALYSRIGLPVLSDDTALEVDALGGAPGVHTARFAGSEADDQQNREKLLRVLQNVPDEQRTARFRTVLCYIDGVYAFFVEGICEGKILPAEQGKHGFGYDSIFQPKGYDRSFAALPSEEKNRISHRRRALESFVQKYRELCQ